MFVNEEVTQSIQISEELLMRLTPCAQVDQSRTSGKCYIEAAFGWRQVGMCMSIRVI